MMSKVNAAILEYLESTGLDVDPKKIFEANGLDPDAPAPPPGVSPIDQPPADAALPEDPNAPMAPDPQAAGEEEGKLNQTVAGEHELIVRLGQALALPDGVEDDDAERAQEIVRKMKSDIIKPGDSRVEALPELKAILQKYTGKGQDIELRNNPATSDEFPPETL